MPSRRIVLWPDAAAFLRQAEAAAGVEKLDGGLWHACRRKWATERKELPLKDVAAAGGIVETHRERASDDPSDARRAEAPLHPRG